VPFNIETSEKEDKEEVQPLYELPDGQVIKVGCSTQIASSFTVDLSTSPFVNRLDRRNFAPPKRSSIRH
jgi:hypothetical protein